jgi:hypothetical protein
MQVDADDAATASENAMGTPRTSAASITTNGR